MNYLGGIVYKGFDNTKNAISQITPHENSVIGNIVLMTVEIGKGVFFGVAPHIINMSPNYLYRMTNIRNLPQTALLFGAFFHLYPYGSWLDTAITGVLAATSIIGFLDLSNLIESEYHVATASLLLLATAIGSSRAIYEGTSRTISSWNAKEKSTTSKVSNFVSGAISTTIGAISFGNSLNQAVLLTSGLKKLQDLDLNQMKAVLKNRAIAELSEEHECTAVIMDGFGMDRDRSEKTSFPFAEELYRNCRTRSYIVNSQDQFCAALEDGRRRFSRQFF